MLLRYTEETLGLAEDKLAISTLPYDVETYFLGSIRLVSIQNYYVPYIPELFHNNIIAQYGLLVSKNNDYFLMLESTIGKSFQEYLEENTPTEEMKILWVRDVSNGIHYLHSLNFWYGELSLDRMHTHGSSLKLEHPAVCERYGQGVEQDLQQLCKLINKISTDERLKRLSNYIESGKIQNADEVCQYLERIIPRDINFPIFDFPEDVADVEPIQVNHSEEDTLKELTLYEKVHSEGQVPHRSSVLSDPRRGKILEKEDLEEAICESETDSQLLLTDADWGISEQEDEMVVLRRDSRAREHEDEIAELRKEIVKQEMVIEDLRAELEKKEETPLNLLEEVRRERTNKRAVRKKTKRFLLEAVLDLRQQNAAAGKEMSVIRKKLAALTKEEDNLKERNNQMNVPSNEPLPMCDLVKESDLGEVESLERDATDTELERICSGTFGCIFLRDKLDESTKALMSEHSLYEALRQTRPNIAQIVEDVRLERTAERIPAICFDIIEHPFVLQPRLMLGPSLNEVTDILYENAPLGTLYKHVEGEDKHFDDTTILQFACQLATAIEYCHQKLKIMHRNINSKSIFVFQVPTGRFYLKLGGFVFARRVSREDALSTNTNRILRFSAPETLQDSSDAAFYSYSSDIWSYGMILDYIAHNGRNPFEELNHSSQLKRALWESDRRPELRVDLHCDLVRLIKACYRSERRGDDGAILPLQAIRPTAYEIRNFLVGQGHLNDEDRLSLLGTPFSHMNNHVAPNFPDRFLGSNEEENRERERMFSLPQYQLIPIAKVQTKSDLQLRPADAEESFLNLVLSETDECLYLESDLEPRTQDILNHSDFYRYMGKMNPDAVEQIAKYDAARNTPRIQDINLRATILHHKFVHQLKYFISSDQYLHNATSILYENAPYGTLERFLGECLGFEENKEKIIFEFTYELASALKYCHIDLGVVHGAVNPKHIFVFEHKGFFYVKLGGLVFAKMPEESRGNTETRNPMRDYCAPETIADGTILSCYEYSSDIYSLGMVAYFMSQGRHPHADCRRSMTEFKTELERGVEPRRLTFDQDLSPLMRELITKCTIIERRNRDGKICSFGLRPTANQVENHLEENGYKPVFI